MTPTLTEPAAAPAYSWRQARVDVFEAAMLLRCTGIASPRHPRHRRVAPALPPGVFAEFSDPAAADRLATLLSAAGVPAGRDEVIAGGRRRYRVHRVSVPEAYRIDARRQLDEAWQEGWDALLETSATGSSSPRRAHRVALSAAAWRAALLAAGRRSRSVSLGVRVSDRDTATALLRGARTLGVPADMHPRTGCWLITIPAGTPLQTLLRAAALHPG
ncbi:MAG: hypothetical protein IRZ05_01050 [Micromonosporaceae bacterium]|jgi:hypothetical protein|nr:hypothetical protein [Micromonosporaceae bacterium]